MNLKGLILRNHVTRDAASKTEATRTLVGWLQIEGSATATRNGSFQLFLLCGGCERKGVQLKWSVLGRDRVVPAIAARLRADAEGDCG